MDDAVGGLDVGGDDSGVLDRDAVASYGHFEFFAAQGTDGARLEVIARDFSSQEVAVKDFAEFAAITFEGFQCAFG